MSHSLSVSQLPSICEENVSRNYRLVWELGALLPTGVQREGKQIVWVTHLTRCCLLFTNDDWSWEHREKKDPVLPFPSDSGGYIHLLPVLTTLRYFISLWEVYASLGKQFSLRGEWYMGKNWHAPFNWTFGVPLGQMFNGGIHEVMILQQSKVNLLC